MHYTIEVVARDEPFGGIIESMRRAGNPTGKAQAFSLARQLGPSRPKCTIFVNEVVSRDEENLIAVYNASDEVKEKYPKIEYLDGPKLNAFEKKFLQQIQDKIDQGLDPVKACGAVILRLQQVFNDKF